MLIETPTIRPGTPQSAQPADPSNASARRRHDDAPDTMALFGRLAGLPDGPERDAVRDELVTAWLPMAHRIAGRFRDRGESIEDLRQVAALGLVKAIDRFDPERGAFESYAVPTITGEVKRHFRDRMWALEGAPPGPGTAQQGARRPQGTRPESGQPGTLRGRPRRPHRADRGRGRRRDGGRWRASAPCHWTPRLSAGDDGYSLADTLGAADAS
ncbi:SigB/SigF/SigG family RNA polymerase sigma factor [Streptomyces violaceorubidus]